MLTQQTVQIGDKGLVYTSGKDGIFYEGISVGQALFENEKYKVKLFSDPTQILFVNVILEKAVDLEDM